MVVGLQDGTFWGRGSFLFEITDTATAQAAPTVLAVALLPGHLLKDPDTTLRYHAGDLGGNRSNPPKTIDPTLEALAAALGASQ